MDTPELSKIEKSVKDDIASIDAHEAAAKSWLASNYEYAIAIAVGSLVLGMSIGFKIAAHVHV